MTYKAFFVLALASAVSQLPSSADAQAINQQIRNWLNPPPPFYGQHWQGLPAQQPISRQQLQWLNQLGGGQDQYGTFNNPVPANRIVPGSYPDGAYRFPMQWDEQNSILLQIQNGNIMRQDYVLPY